MTATQTFNFETANIRTVIIDGEVWFCAKDVCEVLAISKYRDAISRLDPDQGRPVKLDTPGGKQEMTFICESGFYDLTLTSNKPKAKNLRKWVSREVLPSIRKTGKYEVAPQLEAPADNLPTMPKNYDEAMEMMFLEFRKRKDAENYAKSLKEDAMWARRVKDSKRLYTITEIAKGLDTTAIKLNRWLHEQGIIYRVGGTGPWVLYADYQGCDLTQMVTTVTYDSDGNETARTLMKWTEKGRQFIYTLYDRRQLPEGGLIPGKLPKKHRMDDDFHLIP